MPLVTLIRPAFGIFFALTMVVQAFACGYIGIKMLTDNQQRGIALAMAAVLAIKGASIGLLSGVVLYFVIEHKFTPKVVDHDVPKSVSCG
ncbi:MAG: hypothetical protein KGZ63_12430 [Clostridiales bacterium]|jgi:hypothetical protein|nr:hypothetical protein [Clostridiales bacterium]